MSEPFRVLVTGSRNWPDYGSVCMEIGEIFIQQVVRHHRDMIVVHGGAKGADTFAAQAARAFGVSQEPHPADWAAHGKRAGFIRNAEMVAAGADLCLAFIKDRSRGATHCANLALKARIPTRMFTP